MNGLSGMSIGGFSRFPVLFDGCETKLVFLLLAKAGPLRPPLVSSVLLLAFAPPPCACAPPLCVFAPAIAENWPDWTLRLSDLHCLEPQTPSIFIPTIYFQGMFFNVNQTHLELFQLDLSIGTGKKTPPLRKLGTISTISQQTTCSTRRLLLLFFVPAPPVLGVPSIKEMTSLYMLDHLVT